MAGREIREYTNLSDPKDKKFGKGKDKIDDEDITFQRMVAKLGKIRENKGKEWPAALAWAAEGRFTDEVHGAERMFASSAKQAECKAILQGLKMQEVAGERGGYLHGRGALDSDDLLYLKEQMEAEEDAERLLRRTEKRAFAAFKRAANLADSSPVQAPLSLRAEPKPKSGIRQQDLLKKLVEIKPKRSKLSSPSEYNQSSADITEVASSNHKVEEHNVKQGGSQLLSNEQASQKSDDTVKSLLGLAYECSDSED